MLRDDVSINEIVMFMRCNYCLQSFFRNRIEFIHWHAITRTTRGSIRTDYNDAFPFCWLPLIRFLRSIDKIGEVCTMYIYHERV